ncbi:uncharacterized protein LOC110178343 [Drosophila serrata]|uniref:uncharacterized protein LOC110178343 n=1 Tax=Drosophila serrata TaxID=7274 RepID=UPI000A1D0015|nr:uncharacterized protein LOC110178343 [Drosophila serrata]
MNSSGKTGGWSAATLATPRGRANTTSGVTVRAKLVTESLSTQSAGTRKAVHGGAGDGGGTGAAPKQPGRRQVKSNPPPSRLVQSTISSALRARQTAKQQSDQAVQGKTQTSAPPSKGTDGEFKKPTKQRVMSQAAKQAARARLWPTRQTAGAIVSKERKEMPATGVSEPRVPEEYEILLAAEEAKAKEKELLETGIQTNEAEILDHRLLLGYVNMVSPSAQLVQQIDRERRERKARNDRLAARRFANHEQGEELHLDELREFSDRNAVTKRLPKKLPSISYATYDNQYQNVFKSMDEFFSREVPKSEPVANIQERIKRKEQELLSLFDNVEGEE